MTNREYVVKTLTEHIQDFIDALSYLNEEQGFITPDLLLLEIFLYLNHYRGSYYRSYVVAPTEWNESSLLKWLDDEVVPEEHGRLPFLPKRLRVAQFDDDFQS